MKFKKYSSIENSYREKEIQRIYEEGFANDDIVWNLTEKAHGCLKKDTLIKMSDGNEKSISSIKQGESVLTYNQETNKIEIKKVKKVICQNLNKKWIKLHFDNGRHLILTEDHKIYTKNRDWIEAKDIDFNDEFLSIQ